MAALTQFNRRRLCFSMIQPLYSERAHDSPYWNEVLETIPRREMDALPLRRWQALLFRYSVLKAGVYVPSPLL